ncbi:chaperone modulator CbpM [Winogradskyella psychrotolerans]|uniref:chaperone modulator CbpM n=1 Tax=Winogradskyella psychrotolerans TaxID=1344585 RepID=UPI001C076F2B|nr:chaperone modulator CbpM [Winogradskyella psychrotolerans]MBU2928810.1 chaperone modulator CbpM [Winogradskyella psychrotolerans]
MQNSHLIPLPSLCTHYQIEMSFFNGLNDYGLIEFISVEQTYCIHQDKIADLEKMIRLHQDLQLNFEGIDTVFNLLEKIDYLKSELTLTQNKLKRFEDL